MNYSSGRSPAGCVKVGCATVLGIILIISVVLWLLSFVDGPSVTRQLEPIPDNVPPAAGRTVPSIDVHAEGRTADKLTYWSDGLAGDTAIPDQALRAYGNAELIARDAWPGCNLDWTTLAGIGWVETRHGSYAGNWFDRPSIGDDGRVEPPIVGIALDGTNNTVHIPDTDGGEFDNDDVYDRAVGPMQFIPQSWHRYGLDASGDGYPDPQNIDDAALAAAKLLCDSGRDLNDPQAWTEAILSYNNSNDYVRKVRDAANSYAIDQPAAR